MLTRTCPPGRSCVDPRVPPNQRECPRKCPPEGRILARNFPRNMNPSVDDGIVNNKYCTSPAMKRTELVSPPMPHGTISSGKSHHFQGVAGGGRGCTNTRQKITTKTKAAPPGSGYGQKQIVFIVVPASLPLPRCTPCCTPPPRPPTIVVADHRCRTNHR